MAERDLNRDGSSLLKRLDERVRNLERKHATLNNEVVNTPEALQGLPGKPGLPGGPGLPGTPGPPGPAATVEALNEGVDLGTFDSADFVGNGVEATLVGSALTVTIASFVFTQSSPSALWHVVHGRGGYPSVTVRRNDGVTIGGFGVDYVDLNTVDISPGLIAGIATLNF